MFMLQYLSSPESQSLRADLIRYIVGVVHPCNEVLCSDIIPRWAIIGWLLTSCQVSMTSDTGQLLEKGNFVAHDCFFTVKCQIFPL